MKDYYTILGVKKEASTDEIRKAYHKLAHEHHPDKGGNADKFKEINEAYQVLSNKEKRGQYDQFGRGFDSNDFNWSWGNPQQQSDGAGFDFSGLGDIFEEFFGGVEPRRKRNPKRGKDIEIGLEINLAEALARQEKEISLEKFIKCQRCQGSGAELNSAVKECFSCRGAGEVQQIQRTFLGSFTTAAVCPECKGEGRKPEKPCNVCQGEGRMRGVEKIKIFIPAGVDQNQVIKVEGGGDQGKKGKPAGDLYIRIIVKDHPIFQRRGDDLFTVLTIPFSKAVLGGQVEIIDLAGKKLILNIPSGSAAGKMLRLTSKGVPHFQNHGQGNLYVELVIKMPSRLSQKQKELLEKLREENL